MLGASGSPYSITHEGKTYEVGRLTQKAMNAFSAWLIDRRRERLVAACGGDQAELAKQLAELREEALAGTFDFLEPVVMGRPVRVEETRVVGGVEVRGTKTVPQGGALNTHHGRIALAAILCGCTQDEALSLLVGRTAEMNHLLELVMAESFSGAKPDDWSPSGAGDPNAPAGRG